jgi:hypothetical protein
MNKTTAIEQAALLEHGEESTGSGGIFRLQHTGVKK